MGCVGRRHAASVAIEAEEGVAEMEYDAEGDELGALAEASNVLEGDGILGDEKH